MAQWKNRSARLSRPDAGEMLEAVMHDLASQPVAFDVQQPSRIRLVSARNLKHAGD